jgi:hypothetical protein
MRGLHRGDVDDLAPPPRDHVAGDGLADVKDGGDVGLQKTLEGVGGEVLQWRAVLHSGVVHENVDGLALCFVGVDGSADSGVVGGVEGEGLGPRDSCSGGGKFAGVAAVENHLCARSGQPLRQGKADPLRRSRDQRATACQVE